MDRDGHGSGRRAGWRLNLTVPAMTCASLARGAPTAHRSIEQGTAILTNQPPSVCSMGASPFYRLASAARQHGDSKAERR